MYGFIVKEIYNILILCNYVNILYYACDVTAAHQKFYPCSYYASIIAKLIKLLSDVRYAGSIIGIHLEHGT